MPKVTLVEPHEASVDDLVLNVSDEENKDGYSLTDDQTQRLREAPGVKVLIDGKEVSEDPVDDLTGAELDEQLNLANVDAPKDAKVEDKRTLLKDHQEGDSK